MSATTVHDAARLAALESYRILDTPAEEGFDDIVQLACVLCETPVALVSLVGSDRQWFKARIGFEPCETPLSQSVCAHAIEQGDLLVIPDLLEDERTRANTLVTEEPRIRFYAGAVLSSPTGHALGTLCVIDDKPRPEGLTKPQTTALRALAGQVMTQLALRRALDAESVALATVQSAERKLRFALEAGRLGAWNFEIATGVLETSPICRANFGRSPDEPFTYEDLCQAVHPDDRARMQAAVAQTIEHGSDYDIDYRILRRDGSLAWINARAQLDRGAGGQASMLVGVSLDITDRKMAEQQKQLLSEEMAHRVKNSFAVVQAIASQTLRRADPELAETFKNRIVALGQAHDVLLQKSWSAADVRAVTDGVLGLQAEPGRFVCSGPAMTIGAKAALSLSLLLHEMATNAVKYGALSAENGKVEVRWRQENGSFVLNWRESGGPPAILPERRGFGSRLIAMGISGTRDSTLHYGEEGLEAEFSAPMAVMGES